MSALLLRHERMHSKQAILLALLLFACLAGALLNRALLPGKTLAPLIIPYQGGVISLMAPLLIAVLFAFDISWSAQADQNKINHFTAGAS
jgi:hypothetical protein